MEIINVKSMEEIVNNFRCLEPEDLLARAETPHLNVGNKWFNIPNACTDASGLSASAEFHVLDVEEVGSELYRISYKGVFFEMGNGYRCLESKYFSETPRLVCEVKLNQAQHQGLMEHYKFH